MTRSGTMDECIVGGRLVGMEKVGSTGHKWLCLEGVIDRKTATSNEQKNKTRTAQQTRIRSRANMSLHGIPSSR
ncbi:hypothetical protein HETIRDRAFT_440862 [Heterobasidion irregulare TC 32-1]|uniref:Uncharacterized protein n=1 Tax=Heterobasidion irregulare (strain TC 32-1) TaxID=747525 RepID=W4K2F7_HETIT|nr:uncharacterized protein HETIRDRAFT_440862 [Heterobasidion irregulare TC 32-1]ETW79904.1 hypothetical protein HETIRDRAFT_440862 [Heterobasidion irregulare TC 32-1]